ncbi:hypothetical protein [Trinickia mobilis]|uniref:hypothetical protein n=1 Tax=Trinickia mobilis TaxID=2816356 RepID=UPI0035ABB5D5
MRNSVDGDGGAKYLQLDFGGDYNLSKRTDVYALAVLQRASGRDSGLDQRIQPVCDEQAGWVPVGAATPILDLPGAGGGSR